MASTIVQVEGDPKRRAQDIDPLGIAAANLLANLVPGMEVHVTYKKPPSDPPGPITFVFDTNCPGHIGGSFRPVFQSGGWYKQIELRLTERAKSFFARASVISAAQSPPRLRYLSDIPVELDKANAISDRLAQDWGIDLTNHPKPGTVRALCSQLPLSAICHIAADLRYPFFDEALSRRKKHDGLATTLVNVLEYMDKLATTRVEHEQLSHSIVIAKPSRTSRSSPIGTYPEDFSSLKRTPLLSDGTRAALWISPQGEPIGLITPDWIQQRAHRHRPSPLPFGGLGFLAKASAALTGIAVALRRDGSIIIFIDGRPLFMRRGSRWRGIMWSAARDSLQGYFGDIGRVVFDAAVILSMTGHGGVFAIVNQEPSGLSDKDIVARGRAAIHFGQIGGFPKEWLFHRLLPSTNVVDLGPATLAMLSGIDGATIITREGVLLAYGAVVPCKPSESEGARSAAARELSENGFVVKVSADGPISLFEDGVEIIEV